MQLRDLLKKIEGEATLAFLNDFKKKFPDAGIYLVGGAVRDAMLKKESKDFDFVVTGVKKEKLDDFLKARGTVKDIESRSFGVFKFYPKEVPAEGYPKFEPIEIALPRTEKQTGGGYKDFDVKTDPNLPIEADLSRRDFTINAMALDIKTKELVDPFGGSKDLEKNIIRAVGVAKDRFSEDPSRILRALRFAAQLSFEIEKKTWAAIKSEILEINKTYKDKKGKKVERVAREVIAKEFLKGFDADQIKTLELYEKSGAMAELMPEFIAMRKCDQPKNFHSEGDVMNHAHLALKILAKLPKNVKKASGLTLKFPSVTCELKLAVLLHDVGKPPAKKWKEEYGRHVFYGHDTMGAEISEKLIDRLKLTVYAKEHPLHIDRDKIVWMIKNHLFALNTDIAKVSLNALKKRFFREDNWGNELLALAWSDSLASIKEDGKPQLDKILDLTKKIEEIKKEFGTVETLPPLPLNGTEIMELLELKPGPAVGLALEVLSELQLEEKIKDKEEAAKLLKKSAAAIKKLDKKKLSKDLGIRELD